MLQQPDTGCAFPLLASFEGEALHWSTFTIIWQWLNVLALVHVLPMCHHKLMAIQFKVESERKLPSLHTMHDNNGTTTLRALRVRIEKKTDAMVSKPA
eukprot:24372-Amphidinium_carterae.1